MLSHPEMLQTTWKGVHGSHTNAIPFHVKDVTILGAWLPNGLQDPVPCKCQGNATCRYVRLFNCQDKLCLFIFISEVTKFYLN
jgi:hypothetical protein